jgi:HD-GYP domain-containing protein (c-di-GMP phosphodiesterase class II)
MQDKQVTRKFEPAMEKARCDEDICSRVLTNAEQLHNIKDLHALLDKVLLLARQLTRADAGSIYLIKNNVLNFSYIHNDTLFSASCPHKYIYTNQTLPIDNHSLAGYVALTGESLILDDVYQIPDGMPFSFNYFFDHHACYRTKSIMGLPLITRSNNKTVGVMQIINPLDEDGNPVSFTSRDQLMLNYFADHAAGAIERAMMTREIILRMIKMCELRDPRETGAHANRVGAYAAEIYSQWALDQGLATEDIKHTKDLIRIAAMLHDLGKVAISDLILKKPARLNSEEYQTMKYHTIHGARLFHEQESELDALSTEIALNHHEKWDGTGYPGRIDDIHRDDVSFGAGKRGEEIPIAGRIVALADVYDALISRRVYKDSWSEDVTLTYLRDQAGKQFDPRVVGAFFTIYDVISSIREKYQDESPPPGQNLL